VSAGAGLLTLLLLVAVIAIVSGPLRAGQARRGEREGAPEAGSSAPAEARSGASPLARDRAALEAAREAKYRDLRDAELDYRTGKLSSADYEAIRARLRLEALEILDRLEAASDVQQRDRVAEEEHREHDRPAVEVALDHRTAAEGSGAAADAERAGEARVLAGVHEHQQHEHHRDEDL
jgi:hypothetical protein